jgi:exopolysaccharide production protein ExoY
LQLSVSVIAARPPKTRAQAKRHFDLLASLVLLVLAAPVFGMIALLIAVFDPGPVFFRHERVGRGGALFRCLKFRTMRPDADEVLAALLARDAEARAEWMSRRKLRSDPRVTPLGGVLRRLSLDELPQLVNVLRGEMSLVGPRPVTQRELQEFYDPACAVPIYLSLRPGITGSWQISGRSDTDYRNRIALDIHYGRNLSLRRDAAILARTIVAVVRRSGAH